MSQWNVDFPSRWTGEISDPIRCPPDRLASPKNSLLRCPRLARPCGMWRSWRRSEGKIFSFAFTAAARRQFVFFPCGGAGGLDARRGTHYGRCGLGDSTPGGSWVVSGVAVGELGDVWCCIGMVDSWWLLWFLVLDLTKSERFKHVQRKRQNLTNHQHDFCVGDLNLNMCCCNTESDETSERGDWVGTDSGQRCDLASASCARCQGRSSGLGKVHLGDRPSLTLDFTSVKMFGSCSWWWLVKGHQFLCIFGEVLIDLVSFALRAGVAHVVFWFVADWTLTRVLASLLNSVLKFLQNWSVLWPHRYQIQGMFDEFLLLQMWVHVDISNPILLFWPSLVTSSLGEDMPKSWLWESLTRSIAFKRNVPFASCLDLPGQSGEEDLICYKLFWT